MSSISYIREPVVIIITLQTASLFNPKFRLFVCLLFRCLFVSLLSVERPDMHVCLFYHILCCYVILRGDVRLYITFKSIVASSYMKIHFERTCICSYGRPRIGVILRILYCSTVLVL